jgi:hypothetical protein
MAASSRDHGASLSWEGGKIISLDNYLGREGDCVWIRISVLPASSMIHGKLWMADGMDDVPIRPKCIVGEFRARSENGVVDRSDHSKIVAPGSSGWEGMMEEDF